MMTNAQLAAASLDDIVFDGRNQTYGAYVLRHLYQRHVVRALAIATALLALLMVGPIVARLLAGPAPIAPPHHPVESNPIIAPVHTEPIVVPATPPPAASQPHTVAVNSVKFSTFKVVPNDRVTEEIANQDELSDKHVATLTIKDGIDEDDITDLNAKVGPPTGNPTEGTVAPTVYVSVEQMPELVGGGGMAAIVAAIQKVVRYPNQAVATGVEGKVFASFVVNSLGEVTDIKIVKGLGAGLDEETLRAIAKLPKFIPGRQNGRAVSVSFTVPISYRLDK